MNKDEFIKIAKEYGYSDEYIQSCIKDSEDARKEGIVLPLETFLISEVHVFPSGSKQTK